MASATIAAAFADVRSPDASAGGLTGGAIDAARYDGQSDDPLEVAGRLHAMMPAGVRVLDVGCGTGSVTLIANRGRGNTVIAIEPDVQRAAIARSRGLTVHPGFLDDAFIAEHGSFDVVLSSDVVEHVSSPAEFVGSMMRAVKPGGLILLSVPNVAHWSVRLNLLFGRFDYEPVGIMDATHLRWFTRRSFRTLLEQLGLEIVELVQTPGYTLPVYMRFLLGHVPGPIRKVAIRVGVKTLPLLFGVQHVVAARVPR